MLTGALTPARCQRAYVEVRDGGTMMAPRIDQRYCSDERPPTIVTTSNAALINYFTNTSEPRGGFSARVSIGGWALPPPLMVQAGSLGRWRR